MMQRMHRPESEDLEMKQLTHAGKNPEHSTSKPSAGKI